MIKNKVESLLFSSGRKMTIEELSRLCHANPEELKSALAELKLEYNDRGSSVMLVDEGDSWKLSVREQYLPLVQKIITETELSKTIMETLAVIAFKYPIKQSELIKIRTNKAYDHLNELEEMGYISRIKHGRTKLIKLTQKFFEYFNLPEEKLKEQFKDFASIAKAIETREHEIESIKHEQKRAAEEEKQKTEEPNEQENLGDLEVVDEPSEEEQKKERERIQEIKEEGKQQEETKEEKPKFKGEGIKLTKEEEKIVDEKVEKILHPKEEEQESEEPREFENKEENKPEDEPKDLLEAEMEENKDKK
ncbi:MAG: SMC-Scp complex subunit ScpB [Candidatus Woesearchaeota archaeon]